MSADQFDSRGKEQLTRNEIAEELGLELKELHSKERKAMIQLKKVILNEEPELRDLINYPELFMKP